MGSGKKKSTAGTVLRAIDFQKGFRIYFGADLLSAV